MDRRHVSTNKIWPSLVVLALAAAMLTTVAPDPVAAQANRDPGNYVEYVAVATEGARFGRSSVVTSGSVGVATAGDGIFDPSTSADLLFLGTIDDPTLLVGADSVSLRGTSTVFDVATNELLGSGVPLGTVDSVSMPLFALPVPPIVTNDGSNVTVPSGETLVLPPGAYSTVIVDTAATLQLESGLYEFASFEVNKNAVVTATGTTEIRVATTAEFDQATQLTSSDPSVPLLWVLGVNPGADPTTSAVVAIKRDSSIAAVVRAPNGTVMLGARGVLVGAVWGHWLNIKRLTSLTRADTLAESASIEVTNPTDGAVVFGTETVVGTVDGASGAAVELRVDGSPIDAVQPSAEGTFELPWDTTELDDGAHDVVVAVTHNGIDLTSASISVSVDNTLGTVERVGLALARGLLTPSEHAVALTEATIVANRVDPRWIGPDDDGSDDVTSETLDVFYRFDELDTEAQDLVEAYYEVARRFLLDELRTDPNLDPRDLLAANPQAGTQASPRAVTHAPQPNPGGYWANCGEICEFDSEFFTIHYVIDGSIDSVPSVPAANDAKAYDKSTGRLIDPASNGVPDDIDDIAFEADRAVRYFVNDLNYDAPPGANPRIQIHVQHRPGGRSEATRGDILPKWGWEIFLHNKAKHHTIRHEVFHHVQYGYFFARWFDPGTTWWFEASAQWAGHRAGEALLDNNYPAAGNYAKRLPDFLGTTTEALIEGDDPRGTTQRAYGAFIFAEYLEKRFGAEVIRELWEEVRDRIIANGAEDVIWDHDYGVPFPEVLTDFYIASYLLSNHAPNPWSFNDTHINYWRAALANDGRTQDTSATHRPARLAATLSTINDSITGSKIARPGGAVYLDVEGAAVPGARLRVAVRDVAGNPGIQSRLLGFDPYPDFCFSPTSIPTDPGSHAVVPVSVDCDWLTLVMVNQGDFKSRKPQWDISIVPPADITVELDAPASLTHSGSTYDENPFPVTATITNNTGVATTEVDVALNLPPELHTSDALTTTFSVIQPGPTKARTVTWYVTADLQPSETTVDINVGVSGPSVVDTDDTASVLLPSDGSRLLVLAYDSVLAFDGDTWQALSTATGNSRYRSITEWDGGAAFIEADPPDEAFEVMRYHIRRIAGDTVTSIGTLTGLYNNLDLVYTDQLYVVGQTANGTNIGPHQVYAYDQGSWQIVATTSDAEYRGAVSTSVGGVSRLVWADAIPLPPFGGEQPRIWTYTKAGGLVQGTVARANSYTRIYFGPSLDQASTAYVGNPNEDSIYQSADGLAWVESVPPGPVVAMTEHNGEIFIGSSVDYDGRPEEAKLLRYDGVTYNLVRSEPPAWWALASYSGQLYLGVLDLFNYGGGIYVSDTGSDVTRVLPFEGVTEMLVIRDDPQT